MPRVVGEHFNYASDSRFLLRLKEAIALDTRNSLEWKKQVILLCDQLSILLIQADSGHGVQSRQA